MVISPENPYPIKAVIVLNFEKGSWRPSRVPLSRKPRWGVRS